MLPYASIEQLKQAYELRQFMALNIEKKREVQRKVRKVLQSWLDLLDRGGAEIVGGWKIYKSGRRTNLTDEEINRKIESIDTYFELEMLSHASHWLENYNVDTPPQFSRLGRGGRIGLIEDLLGVINAT